VDVNLALQTTRGLATLSDAGEELIDQTFVLVNDVTYVTSEQRAQTAKITMGVLGGLLDAFTGGRGGRDLAEAGAAIADSFTGFKVKTHSYLYQLVWNDSIAAIFYQQHYTAVPNPEKVQAFLDDTTTYRLKYVAHKYEYDEKAVLKGEYTRTELVRTICARSMDKNIVELAKQYEDFKVKTPVYQVLYDDKGRIQGYAAKIGMKEGITDTSKFQVVQRVIDPVTNKTTYKYIATVKPVKGAVWDNRYNAVLEQADGSTLPYTTFKKVGGGEPYRWLLQYVYPGLRHTDYIIEYKVKPFSVEKGRRLIYSHPEGLSLEEMYKVANSYEEGSDGWLDALFIAVERYPDDPTANLNAACGCVMTKRLNDAKKYLSKAGKLPEAKYVGNVIKAMEGSTSWKIVNKRVVIQE
jgi:hypothetical protein